jgi:hypothetical protein
VEGRLPWCLALGKRRELHSLHDDHLLDGRHIHVGCDLVVEEVAKERRTVTEVNVRGKEVGGGAERSDAEVADERWSAGDPAGEEAEGTRIASRA